MARPLTAELIRVRTKSDNLEHVKKFTLCGHDLDDVKILRQMHNIEVLSLSVNKLDTLKEFANCRNLQELYVRKNEIASLSEVRYLANLPYLRTLWLSENPCCNKPYYREYIINTLPQLTILDKEAITAEERAAAAQSGAGYDDRDDEPREVYSPQKRSSHRPEYEDNPRPNSRYGSPGNNYGGRNDGYGERERYREEYQQPQARNGYEERERESYNRNVTSPAKDNRRAPEVRQSVNTNTIKNENVVTAVLMLLKDLDEFGLKIVKKDIEKKLGM